MTNDGDGGFTESGRVPSGDDTCNLATWDFDNDGYPDALVGDADSNRVSLFLNDHHYFTSAAEPIRVFRSFQPNMFFVEDVDRNGVPDIVIANEGAHTVTVLIASAPLNYGTEQIHTYVTGIEPEDVAPGDLNNDGFPDFVVGNYVSADLHVFINDRTGHFDRHTVYPAGRGAGRATVGDLNGDGFADVVVANYEDANIYLYFNRGDGRLLKPVRLRTGEGPGFLWIDDLDADGAADILVTNYISNDVYVFFGRPPAG
ncbi:MAG: VCBS repeat-containing protein [Deltaproteobacteria bacterium]|nr:VCBS repeat-containing protein [Deltaproteobacteria bacterium]